MRSRIRTRTYGSVGRRRLFIASSDPICSDKMTDRIDKIIVEKEDSVRRIYCLLRKLRKGNQDYGQGRSV
ncbi:MAG: hypothetical protein LWW97_11975 [Deltaproteobacteria bacterium]|nr:hypothetical protein [Deltaproteobacteria bacterium]